MIKRLSSKEVYKNNWMRVREDDVQFANGHQGIFGVVEKDDFALIIPFDGTSFVLVRQYRYPIEKDSWEFPQGKHEDSVRITPIELAKQELQEETGITAQAIEEIGFFYEAPGYSNQGFHIFFARNLQFGKQELEQTEQDLKFNTFSIAQFEEMVTKGEITDAPTISAFGLLKIKKII